jgi:hypothetical protein
VTKPIKKCKHLEQFSIKQNKKLFLVINVKSTKKSPNKVFANNGREGEIKKGGEK